MNIICNTLEEYKEALIKHEEYIDWSYKNDRPYLNRFYGCSVSKDDYTEEDFNHYVIYEYNCLNEAELNKYKNYLIEINDKYNGISIVNKVLENLGKEVRLGTVIGLQVTEEDYYYVYKNKDGKIVYNTCVGKIDD